MTETVAARNATLETLVDVLREQNARKLDLIVPATKMRARGGNLVLAGTEAEITEDGVTPTEGVYRPTAVFDEGVAEKLGIPVSYLRRLRTEAPDLYDTNVNAWLHGRQVRRGGELEVVRPADDRSFAVRLFRGDGDEGVARALLSNGYRFIDNFDVLTAGLDGIRKAGVNVQIKNADLTDRRMYVDVFSPDVVAMAPELLKNYRNPFADARVAEQRRGGVSDVEFWRGVAEREGMGYAPGTEPVVFGGFRLSNSEVGGGAFTLTPKLMVKICRNGLVINALSERQIHVGGKHDDGVISWSHETQVKELAVITSKVTDAVRAWLTPEFVAEQVGKIEAAAGKPVEAPEKQIQQISSQLKFTKAEADGILDHFIRGGQMTAGGVLNAVTSFSQTVADADRADALDREAIKVLQLV